MIEGIWFGRVSKKTAINNSMPYTYGRSKHIIEQRRNTYQQEYEKTTNEFNEYIKQSPILMDIDKIIDITNNLVQKNQYQLLTEFERRRVILFLI
jgi:hypothetical protein